MDKYLIINNNKIHLELREKLTVLHKMSYDINNYHELFFELMEELSKYSDNIIYLTPKNITKFTFIHGNDIFSNYEDKLFILKNSDKYLNGEMYLSMINSFNHFITDSCRYYTITNLAHIVYDNNELSIKYNVTY